MLNKLKESPLKDMPIIAILRGIKPEQIIPTAEILVANGIKVIEVPLNSPQALASIKILADNFGKHCLCGAGTVTTVEAVQRVKEAGGELIISPNTNVEVIKATIALDMVAIPGFQTASEAFTAIAAGANYLKFFPANSIGADYLKNILSVLPKTIKVIATGGITPNNLQQWLQNGAIGAGIGSNIFHSNIQPEAVASCARELISEYKNFNENQIN